MTSLDKMQLEIRGYLEGLSATVIVRNLVLINRCMAWVEPGANWFVFGKEQKFQLFNHWKLCKVVYCVSELILMEL